MATAGKTTATRRTRAATPAEEAPAPKKETVSQLRNRLRNEAERKVINNHKDEFVRIATDLFAEHGMEFNRRLTESEKAQKTVEDLLAQYPELRTKIQSAAYNPDDVGIMEEREGE